MIKKPWYLHSYVLLAVFLVAYLSLVHYGIRFELSHDEARHATQGVFYYHYVQSVFHGQAFSLEKYLLSYIEKVRIEWWALYDPPFHALVTALCFSLFGISRWAARLPTELFVVLGVFLFYRIAQQILKDEKKSLCATILLFLIPPVFEYAGLAFIDVTGMVLALGWYLFFFRDGKWNFLLSTFFLIAAFLTRYQYALFLSGFIIVWSIVSYLKKKKDLKNISFFILGKYLGQIGCFLLMSWRWLYLSLFMTKNVVAHEESTLLFFRVFFEGVQRSREWTFSFWTYYFSAVVRESALLVLFAVVALYYCTKGWKKCDDEKKKAWIFLGVVLLIGTLAISNRQLRYLIIIIPFLVIFSVEGIFLVAARLLPPKRQFLSWLLIGFFACLFLFMTMKLWSGRAALQGNANDEITQHLATIPDPKLIVILGNHIGEDGSYQRTYDATVDLLFFQILSAQQGFLPKKFGSSLLNDELIEQTQLPFLERYAAFADKQPVVIIMFKEFAQKQSQRDVESIFFNRGFERKEISSYIVLEKLTPDGSLQENAKAPIITSIKAQQEYVKKLSEVSAAYQRNDVKRVADAFLGIYELLPMEENRNTLVLALEKAAYQSNIEGNLKESIGYLEKADALGSEYAKQNLPQGYLAYVSALVVEGRYEEARHYLSLVNVSALPGPAKKDAEDAILALSKSLYP